MAQLALKTTQMLHKNKALIGEEKLSAPTVCLTCLLLKNVAAINGTILLSTYLGKVFKVSSLDSAGVEAFLPPSVKSDVLVDVGADVTDVDGLKVLQEVAVGHPEAAVVERLRVQLLPDVVGDVGPPRDVLRVPGADPVDGLGAGTVLDTDDLAPLTKIGHLGHSVHIPDDGKWTMFDVDVAQQYTKALWYMSG